MEGFMLSFSSMSKKVTLNKTMLAAKWICAFFMGHGNEKRSAHFLCIIPQPLRHPIPDLCLRQQCLLHCFPLPQGWQCLPFAPPWYKKMVFVLIKKIQV